MNAAALRENPLRVVIIDDTDDLRDLLRLALERGGLDVVAEAGDGMAGIRAVQETEPDVVLLDLSMPVMDGLEALPHLRALAPDAKIIVLSGFGATQMAERALAKGADGYLQKGMSLRAILDRVQEIALGPAVEAPAARPLQLVPDRAATAWDALALAPYGVLEVEARAPFRVVHANPAAATLLGAQPATGSPLGEASVALSEAAASHVDDEKPDFTLMLSGGSVRVTARRASGSMLFFLARTSDEIDELRRTVATTAHEIRGPVAVLSALAETITQQDVADSHQRERLLSSVARQARVLDGITADLLVSAQLQRGVLRMERRALDVADAVEAAVAAQQVQVTVVLRDDRPVVADPQRLEQMLGNLLRNAVKYGRPPIVVRVRANPDDDTLLDIAVEDHGSGVPEDFRGRLFHEFSRAAGTTAHGVGLGLSIVRTLAEAHGGSVSYAPAPHGGAVFTLSLPTG